MEDLFICVQWGEIHPRAIKVLSQVVKTPPVKVFCFLSLKYALLLRCKSLDKP